MAELIVVRKVSKGTSVLRRVRAGEGADGERLGYMQSLSVFAMRHWMC